MKKAVRAGGAILLMILALTGCAGNQMSYEEQCELGASHLSAGSFEEAIFAFAAAITLDPNRAEAYAGRGDAYLEEGMLPQARADYEAALAVWKATGDAAFHERITELENKDFGPLAGEVRRMSVRLGDGKLLYSHAYTYDLLGRRSSATAYNPAGEQTGHMETIYDIAGNKVQSYTYASTSSNPNAQTLGRLKLCLYEYDENGNQTRISFYDEDGNPDGSRARVYDTEGRETELILYGENGEIIRKLLSVYDASGNCVRQDGYAATGEYNGSVGIEYNASGEKVREISYFADGSVADETVYEYAPDGSWEKSRRSDFYGFIDDDWRFFDESGKLTRVVKEHYGERTHTTVEYIFEYAYAP